MNKRMINPIFALIMMSSVLEIRPIFNLTAAKKALVALPYIAFVGCFSNIAVHCIQLKRWQELKQRCRNAETNTHQALQQDSTEIRSHSLRTPRGLVGTQIFLECMKNKEENLQNYFHCEELLEQAQDIFEKIASNKAS